MSWMNAYGQERARNKRLIQLALDNAGLNAARIAEKVGVTPQTVSATLNGHCHSPRVLDELRRAGVPESLIADPHRNNTTA